MLTKLSIKRFKRFGDVEIELGNPVVFIGPNDSGKTSALQALALWDTGLRKWNERRAGKTAPEKRPGVTINRRDLLAVPVPDAIFLWRDLGVRSVKREGVDRKQSTQNLRVDIVVDGLTEGVEWTCGLEFDYANQESIYCRPLRLDDAGDERLSVPPQAGNEHVAFLPPMSGLTATETRLDSGAINVRVGEGRTAEVLRNLCYQVYADVEHGQNRWDALVGQIKRLFGVHLNPPTYVAERGEITMTYQAAHAGVELDLVSSGRGMQQTLLLLAHLTANPGAVLLLDEPDAHLEVLRQRQIYRELSTTAQANGSQLVIASHSEVVLNEAADRDVVVAFIGSTPHRIDDRGSQLLKALKDIGFDEYSLGEITGWVLYLEGSTDLAILQSFAQSLDHPAARCLERPFVKYVANQPRKAREHFFGLREALAGFVGVAVFDRLDDGVLQEHEGLTERMWPRRELENYLCQPQTLVAFARASAETGGGATLFDSAESVRRTDAMDETIRELVPPVALADPTDQWWRDTKASDDFLDRLFPRYYERLSLPNQMAKSDYHVLATHVTPEFVSDEVVVMLDMILKVGSAATPVGGSQT